MNGVAKMPKVGMQPIRRRQLIDATLEAINEVGMHDATIAQIGDIFLMMGRLRPPPASIS